MNEEKKGRGMGWIPDYPDFRDHTEETKEVRSVLGPMKAWKGKGLPPSIDLRPWCSPIEDQGALGSCTAHAGVRVIEYYEGKSFGRHIDASRLFLYKVTGNIKLGTGSHFLKGSKPLGRWQGQQEDCSRPSWRIG